MDSQADDAFSAHALSLDPHKRWIEAKWRMITDAEGARVGAQRVSDHPRYQTLALIAHAVAAAANAGKLMVYSGNPVALNYAQWLTIVKAFLVWYTTA